LTHAFIKNKIGVFSDLDFLLYLFFQEAPIKKNILNLFYVSALSFFIAACASEPKLYPNAKYKQVGADVAQGDVHDCLSQAEQYAASGKWKKAGKGATSGAAVGGAIGAASGLFRGDFLGSAVRGGVIGAAAGGASAAVSPDQIKHSFTNQCLHDKGYQVIGWD
jgi:outer membrane lipoprotein SlyB